MYTYEYCGQNAQYKICRNCANGTKASFGDLNKNVNLLDQITHYYKKVGINKKNNVISHFQKKFYLIFKII